MSRTLRFTFASLLLALTSSACSREDEGSKADKKDAKSSDDAKADTGASASDTAASGTTSTTSTTSTGTTTGEPPADTEEGEDEETGELQPVPESFADLGVAVCDQYVDDYLKCIDEKAPQADRESHKRIVADNHAAWSQTLQGGDAATQALQIGCRAAREQAKTSTASWGCTW